MSRAGIIAIIIAKFAVPVGIVFSPFIFGWLNFVLDTVDGDLLIPLGMIDANYQPIDKLADMFTYVGMVAAAWHHKWLIRKWIYSLFALRFIGQALFFITNDERVFFYFPNFLEPLFLIYATMLFFRGTKKAEKAYLRYRIPIWIFVVVYKMQDEYITHIGNIDRSELIGKLFGS